MNPKTKHKWIAALRSDYYKQGKQYLAKQRTPKAPIRHCCLGVLCEILPYVERIQRNNEFVYVATEEEERSSTILPFEIAQKEGLDRSSPWIDYPGKDEFGYTTTFRISLVELNDTGFTFNQIADLIERFL